MKKKQSSIDLILNAFNLLSDSDFKAWMLNNYDVIKAMHKEEIKDAVNSCGYIGGATEEETEQYYNETYGGNNE